MAIPVAWSPLNKKIKNKIKIKMKMHQNIKINNRTGHRNLTDCLVGLGVGSFTTKPPGLSSSTKGYQGRNSVRFVARKPLLFTGKRTKLVFFTDKNPFEGCHCSYCFWTNAQYSNFTICWPHIQTNTGPFCWMRWPTLPESVSSSYVHHWGQFTLYCAYCTRR